MEKEMFNINGNVVGEIKFGVIESKEGEVPFANFTIVRKNKDKKKEYIYCNLYGDKTDLVRDFESGEYIHVFGYFKEVKKKKRFSKTLL